mgnify:CR=1 FL=1
MKEIERNSFKIKNIKWNSNTLKFILLILLLATPFGVTSNFVLWNPKNSFVTAGASIGVKIVSYILFHVDERLFPSIISKPNLFKTYVGSHIEINVSKLQSTTIIPKILNNKGASKYIKRRIPKNQ